MSLEKSGSMLYHSKITISKELHTSYECLWARSSKGFSSWVGEAVYLMILLILEGRYISKGLAQAREANSLRYQTWVVSACGRSSPDVLLVTYFRRLGPRRKSLGLNLGNLAVREISYNQWSAADGDLCDTKHGEKRLMSSLNRRLVATQ